MSLLPQWLWTVSLLCVIQTSYWTASSSATFTKKDIAEYREKVKKMFQHGYDNYVHNAYPYDELQPLTCDGVDTWGSYSLTLIDALDTLAIMGNFTEFRRVARHLIDHLDFDEDINVSVFETNIRVVGGLLSAHLLSRRAGLELDPGWPCEGPLLSMAETVARRLLPAFNTPTKIPYGTVNLVYGVPKGETPITCTAGGGTFAVEFGTLSRLTGDPIFEKTALDALDAIWKYKSDVGLIGNHIDVNTGKWTATDSGVGAGCDSYYEYLVKAGMMLGNKKLLDQYYEYDKVIQQFMKRDDWYMWVNMKKGTVTMPVFQSLEAFYPGLQSLLGKVDDAMKTLHNYYQVWRQLGFIPEFYNIVNGKVVDKREGYPLRPELIESIMYLYRATKDPMLLEMGRDIYTSIETSSKTPCGYTTIKDVRTHKPDNRMESFFLSETTKYLYLLFDPDNFIHNPGGHGEVISTPYGECVVETGGYIFNTEAHPIDSAALNCCQRTKDTKFLSDMFRTLETKSAKLRFLKNFNSITDASWMSEGLPGNHNCSAQPFHARLSIMGEMYEEQQLATESATPSP